MWRAHEDACDEEFKFAMTRFSGKVAIVTGAASGIGEAIVRGLLFEGARVVGVDINADRLADRRREFGADFHASVGDVTDEASVEHFVLDCATHFGQLHLAFNVAGGSRGDAIIEHSVRDWQFTVDLCLKGVFLAMKHEARLMLSGGGGAIVNVSSVCARFPVAGSAAYCAAKAGVEMLTKVTALELARSGIRVNTVLPGYTHTPGMQLAAQDPSADRAIVDRIPLARAATPAEIAGPAIYLATDEARYITGTSLVVDGGWELTTFP